MDVFLGDGFPSTMRCGPVILVFLAASLAVQGDCVEPAPLPVQDRPQFRRPVAAAWLEPGRLLLTANRRSGTLTVVDVERGAVLDEFVVGERLSALAPLPDPRRFVVADDRTHELIIVHFDAENRLHIDGRATVSAYPAAIAVAADGATGLVTGLWSHAVDVVGLAPTEQANDPALWNVAFPHVVGSIALPFPPREVALLPDADRAVVVDAYGGRFAVIDTARRTLASQHQLDGHNLRGLRVDVERRELLLVGQRLDPQTTTEEQHVRSGLFMSNRLWHIALDRLATPSHDFAVLDRPGVGAADPNATADRSDGGRFVTSGGSQRLIAVDERDRIEHAYDVGARPVAVVVAPDGRRVYVVNQLDDSVSVVDLVSGKVREIALGPLPEPYPRDRGERLFFDARLSAGGFMSCHSCHTDGHTIGLTADTLGDGTYGTPKRVLSLLGTALTDHWAWNGSLRELREQVRQSFETTMHARPLRAEQHDDVVAFLHTLPLPPPLEPSTGDEADRQRLARGRDLFSAWKCGDCHVGPLTYTSQGAYDVGLQDERGLAKFNPPSLRGVGHGAGFFHDNRAATLGDVFRVFGHRVPDAATDDDLDALVRFLRSL